MHLQIQFTSTWAEYPPGVITKAEYLPWIIVYFNGTRLVMPVSV